MLFQAYSLQSASFSMSEGVSVQSTHQGCRKFSIFIKDLSTQPNLRNVIFAEVDVGSEDLKVTSSKA